MFHNQEDIKIINVPESRTSKYIKQKLRELNGKIVNYTIMENNFSTNVIRNRTPFLFVDSF